MTEPESRELERLIADERESHGCYWAVWAVTIPAIAGAIFLVAFPFVNGIAGASGASPHDIWRMFGTLALFAALVAAWLVWVGRPRRRSLLAEDLATQEVDLVHVHAFAAARTSEGSYFFDVGDGKLLHLRGHYLRAALQAGSFPNRYFTVVRLPRSERTLAIECHGEPLPPLEVEAGPEIAWRAIPEGALVPARLERLREDLLVLLGSGWRAS